MESAAPMLPDQKAAVIADDAQMFELAPVSLWLEDYSGVKTIFETWRRQGITDLRAHLLADPSRVTACSSQIRVIKVNRRTLALFEAHDLEHLVANIDRVFRDDMLISHVDELVQLWLGNTDFFSTTVNYSLSGRRTDVSLCGTILPGHHLTWDRVLVSLDDVSEREAARRNWRSANPTRATCSNIRRSPSGSKTSPP